jgi:hypothetical protein
MPDTGSEILPFFIYEMAEDLKYAPFCRLRLPQILFFGYFVKQAPKDVTVPFEFICNPDVIHIERHLRSANQ